MGLDVGTTTVSLVLFDLDSNTVLTSRNKPHRADLSPDGSGAHLQDPEQILDLCRHLVDEVSQERGEPRAIGVTGQMHGLLYLDGRGEVVSPVYTWLDNRVHWQSPGGGSYADLLEKSLGGAVVPAGYGVATHFVHAQRGTVPKAARYAVTLLDYISMKLARADSPVTDPTMAHSFGVYESHQGTMDQERWLKAEGGAIKLPRLAGEPRFLGTTSSGIPVTTPLGDNQASFIGSVAQPRESLLVNVGTSGQVSLLLGQGARPAPPAGIEGRPFPGGGLLWVGATLTGGKSLDILASLVSETDRLINGRVTSDHFQVLSDSLTNLKESAPLTVVTKFSGTREDGSKRGSITNISTENFSLGHLYRGFLAGVADELAVLWERMRGVEPARIAKPAYLVAGGNALRLSAPLRSAVSERFGMELYQTPYEEAAALGAAVVAHSVSQEIPVTEASRRMVSYL